MIVSLFDIFSQRRGDTRTTTTTTDCLLCTYTNRTTRWDGPNYTGWNSHCDWNSRADRKTNTTTGRRASDLVDGVHRPRPPTAETRKQVARHVLIGPPRPRLGVWVFHTIPSACMHVSKCACECACAFARVCMCVCVCRLRTYTHARACVMLRNTTRLLCVSAIMCFMRRRSDIVSCNSHWKKPIAGGGDKTRDDAKKS